SRRLATQRSITGFDVGIRQFTWMMIWFMLIVGTAIFAINFFTKNFIDALLFSLAVSVGLAPEMLPMLVAMNLSKGAIEMSKKQVIVKQLNSIQNLGAMSILCTDKTGTLTEDKIVLERHCDILQREDKGVLQLAYMNSYYQTGLRNLLDNAILKHEKLVIKQYKKIDEIPFDFSRRVMSVAVEMEGRHRLIVKGAPEEVFKRCRSYELDGEILDLEELVVADLREEYHNLSKQGFRVLAIAYRDDEPTKTVYSKDDEVHLILKGYLAFLDPPKPSSRRAIDVLHRRGVEVKVLTGDNDLVTKKICGDVGLNIRGLLTGDEIEKISDEDLRKLVETTTVFARLGPLQKERIIRLLKQNGHIVGFLGDGINDAPSLKAADVGISVNNAADIAKESADIILLKKSLMVLEDGILEGRRTFGNIIKYIRMGASSNFGNMLSMTGASIFIPFLPMLPIQVLLNNFLYDISNAGIPTDNVEPTYLLTPKRWDVSAIRRFMLVFGPVSSLFDFITFGILYFGYHADPKMFQTGWFLESLITQTTVIHVIRSSRTPFLESSPSAFLLMTTFCIASVGLVIPFTPLRAPFGFVEPPGSLLVVVFFIVSAYWLVAQQAKRFFVRRFGYD
ncbi:MAG: magnesium-translocating P-type ATPase, partial [Elusimicrobia bacterium]|nr:magnesium-translocating P-type ATPase [Elusimicrobiota bacterium]